MTGLPITLPTSPTTSPMTTSGQARPSAPSTDASAHAPLESPGVPLMTNDTQQWIFKLLAVTLCGSVLGFFVMCFVAVFHFGDGEAINIINSLTGPMLGVVAGMATLVIGPHVLSAIVSSKQTAQSGTGGA